MKLQIAKGSDSASYKLWGQNHNYRLGNLLMEYSWLSICSALLLPLQNGGLLDHIIDREGWCGKKWLDHWELNTIYGNFPNWSLKRTIGERVNFFLQFKHLFGVELCILKQCLNLLGDGLFHGLRANTLVKDIPILETGHLTDNFPF